MKACVLSAPAPIETRPLAYEDVPIPEPQSGEVLIKVHACAICRTDLHVIEGDLPSKKLPLIPGHQIVGEIVSCPSGVLNIGQRVGVAWLHQTCEKCRYCLRQQENLCDHASFTGWSKNGGYAEFVAASEAFVYPLPEGLSDVEIAPLLCAGIIGYRSIRLTGIKEWQGMRVGIYGFGAAGHLALQLMKAWGAEVYVATRDQRHQNLAQELGATWVGGTFARPPLPLDASLVFAPAGEIVPEALKALDKGGKLVLGGIHMSPIPAFDYQLIYGERAIQSVTNNTRDDGREFLKEAARLKLKTHTQIFDLDQANDALYALKHDAIKGSGVLRIY